MLYVRIILTCSIFFFAAGEVIEMGGIVDPEKGALIYRKTTEVETVEPGVGSDFQKKKIKTVTSETSWLGEKKKPDKVPLVTEDELGEQPWHDEDIEANPLYSNTDYDSDFHNPLYSRQSAASGSGQDIPLAQLASGRTARGFPEAGNDDGDNYMNYLSAQPGLDNADTLF